MKISECINKLKEIQLSEGDIEVGYDTGMDYAYLQEISNTIFYPGDGSEIPIVSMKFYYD